MKRRDPTRIELKLDDIQEYEQMKRKNENQSAKKSENNGVNVLSDVTDTVEKTRSEVIRSRIGYDPTPRMTTPPPNL